VPVLANGAVAPHAGRSVSHTTEEPPSEEPSPAFVERRVNKRDRRAVTFWTLLRGGFAPRRRGGRRAGEQEQPVDFHEPYLLVLSVLMLTLSIADAFFTVNLMTHGAEETNPFLAFVLNEHPRLFAAVKMGLSGVGVVVLVAVARMRFFRLVRASVVLQFLVLAYAALVAYEAWLVGAMVVNI
jgi:hypothetical protein